ncbi:hypothetical protein [Methylobacterium komagatae]
MTVRLGAATFIFVASVSATLSQPGDVCSVVLAPTVFNTGETQVAEKFASRFKDNLCDITWSKKADIENASKSFGLNYEDAENILGINSSDYNNKSTLDEKYKLFCKKSDKDIAYSSNFFNKFRSSDVAVKAWSDCVHATQEGRHALVVPALDLTGASVKLSISSKMQIPALVIHSVQASGDQKVHCNYNGIAVTPSTVFPQNMNQVTLACLKRADEAVDFTIDTSWGVYESISIPGYSYEVSKLRTDLNATKNSLESEIRDLKQQLNIIKNNVAALRLNLNGEFGKLTQWGRDLPDKYNFATAKGEWGHASTTIIDAANGGSCDTGSYITGIQVGWGSQLKFKCRMIPTIILQP